MLQDTAHYYGLGLGLNRDVTESERKKALKVGIEKGEMRLKIWNNFLPDDVKFKVLKEGKRQQIEIKIGQYSESGECIGDGYYRVLVDSAGKAQSGDTKYWVNGILCRNCKLTISQAQNLADNVVSEVLSSLDTLKLPKRPRKIE